MSYAAVYEVTRAMRMFLHNELVGVSASAMVSLLPPGDELSATSGVNLYLYRVVESPFTKNQPWPGDRSTPPSNYPALGLQLFYLLTPLGAKPDDSSFQLGDDAHTMLGIAMTALHENPILNNVHIPPTVSSPGFDADAVLPGFLLDSYEQIKITLVPVSIDELSKIWATINQPYRLSVAYEVSLVELAPTVPPPVSAGIVTVGPMPQIIALQAAQLSGLQPARGALVHIDGGGQVAGNSLLISGAGLTLAGQAANVSVGGQAVTVTAHTPPPDETVTVGLPSALDAGPQADVVVTVAGRRSVPQTFTVDPWLSNITPIRTALDPAAPSDLALHLTGSGFTATPAAVRLQGAAGPTNITVFTAGGTDQRASVALPGTLANGIYQVRLVLGDGASSATNPRQLQVVPLVTTPIGIATQVVNGRNVHRLTINGARLNGADVRLAIDTVVFQAGQNANATQLVFTLGRLLDPGAHTLTAVVDGQASRTVPMTV